MGHFHERMIILDWDGAGADPDAVDRKMRELAEDAFISAFSSRHHDGVDYPEELSRFLALWSGPRGGRNLNYQACFFSSGSKGGRLLHMAMSRLIDLCKERMERMGVSVAVITTYCESFYEAWEGVTVDYDTRRRGRMG